MLYLKETSSDGDLLSIWKFEESTDELLRLFRDFRTKDEDEMNGYKSEKRQIEYLSVRALLLNALGHECQVLHDEAGKPSLTDEGSLHISISHTKGYASIFLSPNRNVGIDVEQISNRIFRVKNTFLNKMEQQVIDSNDKIQLLLCWSAKETVYKLIPGLSLEYWEQIIIKNLDMERNTILCEVDGKDIVSLKFRVFPEFVLVNS